MSFSSLLTIWAWWMRAVLGAGTPKAAASGYALLWLINPTASPLILIVVRPEVPPDPTSSTACCAESEPVILTASGHDTSRFDVRRG